MRMHVRLNYVAGDPARVGDVVKYVETEGRLPTEDLPGNLGMMLMTNYELGAVVVQTFWDSANALRESERFVAPIRHEMALRGTATVSVEYPEVARCLWLIRPPTGAGVQLTLVECSPALTDNTIAGYEDIIVPWMTDTSGFCAALLLAERGTGRLISQSLWRDAGALAASRSSAAEARTEVATATNSTVLAMEEYSLVFSSLRSP
jgi:heme-degrading monooxygenase HmoA